MSKKMDISMELIRDDIKQVVGNSPHSKWVYDNDPRLFYCDLVYIKKGDFVHIHPWDVSDSTPDEYEIKKQGWEGELIGKTECPIKIRWDYPDNILVMNAIEECFSKGDNNE